jgi:glycerate 2-kinase
MPRIKNRKALIENGENELTRKARAIALASLESALNAADPKKLLIAMLSLENSCLRVGDLAFDLSKFKKLYVLGGGKAGGSMAEALERVLGKRITAGIVNVPYGTKYKTRIVELNEASHPVPDDKGVEGTRRMMQIAEQAQEDDLVVCLFSGGGSSLMPLPRDGVSLEDKREITNALLKSGATINEVNAVRKHLSAFKGGWLAKKAYPATVLNLVLSDVMGDQLDAIASGPVVPDSSTFADALRVLEKYGLWKSAPPAIHKVLSDGAKGIIEETPKPGDAVFKKVHSVVVGSNRVASLAAVECLKSEGLNALLLTATLEGEAAQVGKVLAAIAREVAASGNPIPRPVGIVAGGETTVTVFGKGVGGRNQELALSYALQLKNTNMCVIASLSTDGVDGPTDAAGAIVDTCTLQRAAHLGLDAEEFLADNDSYHFFSKLGDLIFTGQTGTNVNDISVIVVL